MNRAEWEDRHRATLESQQESNPLTAMPLLVSQMQRVPPGRALDLACGVGRNTIWLAERGWHVTAVDRSETAIASVRSAAEGRALPVDAFVADLETGEFQITPGAWDLIVICNYLQRDLFEPAKRGLALEGRLIASALLATADTDAGTLQSGVAAVGDLGGQRFRVQPGELRAYFHDCEILEYEEDPPRPATPSHRSARISVRRKS